MNFADIFALVAEFWATDFLSMTVTFGSVTVSVKALVIWSALAAIALFAVRRLQD